ncbi:MAG: DUF1080 domain-containing protein [Planctomycetota bacterium]
MALLFAASGPEALAQASDADAASMVSLFDGKNLDGWRNPYDWGTVDVVNGEIQLTAERKFFLTTEAVYHDYEFEGEIKLPPGKANSGFMARGQVEPNKVFGYQAEADPTSRRWSGGLYDERRRQWLNPLWDQPDAQKSFDRERWNRYRIRCVGNRLQFYVNDVLTTDYFDSMDLKGHIGLQHHGEKGQTYRFRNLKVRDLGRHEWQPLFDGQSLDRWTAVGGGTWTLVDGVIQGRSDAADKAPNGLLVFDQPFANATFRIEYRCENGDSGFFVRSTILDAKPFIKGVQCEIDNTDDVAGLYQTGGAGWLVHPLDYLETAFPPDRRAGVEKHWQKARSKGDDWNTLVISLHGNRIVTHLNDCLASDHVVADLEAKGQIALQLHGNQDLKVDFRKVEVLRQVIAEK